MFSVPKKIEKSTIFIPLFKKKKKTCSMAACYL